MDLDESLTAIAPGPGTILAIVGGIRLAKPRSFWARHLYDRKTMAKSIERHEPPINLDDYPEPRLPRVHESTKGGAGPSIISPRGPAG